MDFIQHFLIGKPLEHNAQTSYMVSGTRRDFVPASSRLRAVALDAETADSELTEFQPGPATDGTPAANAIRPAGLHYDYTVDSWTLSARRSRSTTHLADPGRCPPRCAPTTLTTTTTTT